MKTKFAPLVLAAVLASALPQAQAITLSSVVANGNAVSTDFLSAEMLSADVFFANDQAVTLNLTVDGNESGADVDFNSILTRPFGQGFQHLLLSLGGGATFSFVGDAVTLGGTGNPLVNLSLNSQTAFVLLDNASETQLELGSPFGDKQDWKISLQGLAAGSAVSLTVSTVPEPGSVSLMLAALGMGGLMVRRRAR